MGEKRVFSKGQSLFEVVMALAVVTMIIVGIVALASHSIRNTTFSRNKTLASRYAQEATEWLRGQRDEDVEVFRTNTQTTLWCFQNLSWADVGTCGTGKEIADTPFKREVTFSSSLVGGKVVIQADIKVYWADSQGDHEVRSVTDFTDWRER